MAKVKGPTFGTPEDQVERRPFTVHRHGLERPSSRIVYFYCPFCTVEVKAYVWSLCGGGKRCGCGALFSGSGAGIHWSKNREQKLQSATVQ